MTYPEAQAVCADHGYTMSYPEMDSDGFVLVQAPMSVSKCHILVLTDPESDRVTEIVGRHRYGAGRRQPSPYLTVYYTKMIRDGNNIIEEIVPERMLRPGRSAPFKQEQVVGNN